MTPCYCTLLRTATRRISATYNVALEPFGFNVAQYALLRIIKRRPQISFSDLGHEAALDRSTIGRNIRVLERKGLVEAERSQEDRRETVVALTERGLRLVKEAKPVWQECQREIELKIGPEIIATLRDIATGE